MKWKTLLLLSVVTTALFVTNVSSALAGTIGYTSIGGGADPFDSTTPGIADEINAYTASAGDTITSFSFYGGLTLAGSDTIDVAIYTFSGGVPVTKVGSATLTINSTTPTWWNSSAVSIPLTAGVVYVVAWGNITGSKTINSFRDDVNTRSVNNASGALPSTWTEVTTQVHSNSAYATYVNIPTAINSQLTLKSSRVQVQSGTIRISN